ncbi:MULTISPECIES: polysaccharide biosynthesis tyrosine autokinase [unclassified Microbacterium]|uniref:polysaccharide biosynthesis tyrosine autokinase n=1 Tax=unclassified Microbacterium TaxID=2609290 RepID=UPI0012F89452|nr:polysaccharide biosynthesis tyrosine autokinase [Microbacterium sp. MAH-37]MVQ42639.1 polysaccharide biosynthesis tyrosine autokinase [Microbacterium sp. MAH-37]
MELRDYTRALRRHWIAIVVMTLLGVGVGFGWAWIQTPVYQADASGLIQVKATDGTVLSPGQGDSLAKTKVPTYLEMAQWRQVAEQVAQQLDLTTPPQSLIQMVTVTNPEGTAIVKVTAQGESPEAARNLAEAWVKGLIVVIDQTEGTGAVNSAPANIVLAESAALPTSPVFPDKRMAMLVGGILGLGGGIAFAMMRAISDRRIRATDDVEKRVGIPVVGALPDAPTLADGHRLYRNDGAVAPGKATKADFAIRESLRMLRTNLQFMDVDHPPRTIVVTSALPGEGKSTMASNLAGALSAAGQKVVLIDGDLRRPTIAATMGVTADIGLTDVLAGRVRLADVLHRVPELPNLVMLGAGTLPHNPSELLGSDRMHELLNDLAQHAIVIVDAPPLLSVTDAAVLTHRADGALIVASAGKTTYDLVDKAIDALEKIHGRVLGLVLNKVPMTGTGSDVYSYTYEYTTAGGDAKGAMPKRTEAAAEAAAAAAAVPSPVAPPAAPPVPDAPSTPVADAPAADTESHAPRTPRRARKKAEESSDDDQMTEDVAALFGDSVDVFPSDGDGRGH